MGIERGLLTAGMQSFLVVLGIIGQFDCLNVGTYYFYGNHTASLLDPSRCTDILTPDETSKCLLNFVHFKTSIHAIADGIFSAPNR